MPLPVKKKVFRFWVGVAIYRNEHYLCFVVALISITIDISQTLPKAGEKASSTCSTKPLQRMLVLTGGTTRLVQKSGKSTTRYESPTLWFAVDKVVADFAILCVWFLTSVFLAVSVQD